MSVVVDIFAILALGEVVAVAAMPAAVVAVVVAAAVVVVVAEPPRITEGSVAVLTRPGAQTLEARNRLLS